MKETRDHELRYRLTSEFRAAKRRGGGAPWPGGSGTPRFGGAYRDRFLVRRVSGDPDWRPSAFGSRDILPRVGKPARDEKDVGGRALFACPLLRGHVPLGEGLGRSVSGR